MRLFIRIKNGRPFQHPIAEENMQSAFPNVNLDDLPDGFAEFVRVVPPELSENETLNPVEYAWDGDVVKDVWTIQKN